MHTVITGILSSLILSANNVTFDVCMALPQCCIGTNGAVSASECIYNHFDQVLLHAYLMVSYNFLTSLTGACVRLKLSGSYLFSFATGVCMHAS